jgi:hypothetical protein
VAFSSRSLAAAIPYSATVSAGQITLERALHLMHRHNPELSAVGQELTVARGELQKASYHHRLSTGIKADVAVHIYRDDFDR